MACLGFSSLNLMVVVRGGLISPGGGDEESCDRLDFFTGGSSPSAIVLGGEGCEAVRERLGTVIPSSDKLSDFRLVLYGMVGDAVAAMFDRCHRRDSGRDVAVRDLATAWAGSEKNNCR